LGIEILLRILCKGGLSRRWVGFEGMVEFLGLIKGGKNARSRPKLDSDY
jgi:hypothetical protein